MACPICEKPGVDAYRPFCSKRCADLDLARWLGEGYAIPGEELEEAEEEQSGMRPKAEERRRPQ